MNEKEVHRLYLTILCDLLNECKFHNFSFTDDQLKKIASKRVLEKIDQQEVSND